MSGQRFGVWGNCDSCGHDSWVVVAERDWMDEPTEYVCGGGCELCPECEDEDFYNDDDSDVWAEVVAEQQKEMRR